MDRYNLVDTLKLPKDLCLKALNIRLIGQYEVFVENYRSIIEYSASVIKLQGKSGRVRIEGENLTIVCFSRDDMKIKGYIRLVEFYQSEGDDGKCLRES